METMFPGKVNSPATTLDGAIDNTVTTIDVIDGSVLPTAPNIAVIGVGEDAETILYGTKATNQLTSVTRGYQGTAKAWDSGATIARLFTEYDYASLKANIGEIAARKLSAFAATTSAELAGVISDETGTDKLVYNTSPTLVTPILGTPTSGVLTNCTGVKVVTDTTPELGGELDAGAHSIGFTQQSATGDGTTTIDWTLGNKFYFTFGAQNDTFTFTAPTNPCNLVLVLKQDGTGSRTATFPNTVMWAGGTAPTLTTTAAGINIVSFYFDGTNFFGVASLAFA